MKLTAIKEGFYGGARIRVGQSFEFKGEKLPKWAKPHADAAKAIAEAKAKEIAAGGDTKPKEAQAAAKVKAEGRGG